MKQNNSTILTLAVVVALFALISLVVVVSKVAVTGNAINGTDTGTADLTILSTAELEFTTNAVSWGAGSVNTGETLAILDTDAGNVTNGNWSNVSQPLVLQNNGNTNLNISLKASHDAASFLGGTNPYFKLKVSDNEAGACADNNSVVFGSFADVNGTAQLACANMSFKDSSDALDIDVQLGVPYDSLTGSQSSVITATGTAL